MLLALSFTTSCLPSLSFSSDQLPMDEVVVTAVPGVAQNILDVQASVEVFNRQRLDALSLPTAAQILEHAAGVFAFNSGSSSKVSIRGFDNTNTLILVNGMRRTGRFQSVDLTGISVESIERVEIVRGPLSALYGADSSGGVINIITRSPDEDFSISGSILYGSADHGGRNSHIERVSINSGSVGDTTHRLAVERRQQDPLSLDDNSSDDLAHTDSTFATYQGAWSIDSQREMRWSGEYLDQDDRSKIVYGPIVGEGIQQENRHQFDVNYRDHNSQRIIDLTLAYGDSDSATDVTGNGLELHDHQQIELNSYLTLTPNDSLIVTLGAGGRQETARLSTFESGDNVDRDVYHLLGQTQLDLPYDISIMAGLRHDDYSDAGGTTNPRMSVSWAPNDWRFRVGYGEGFRAPRFLEMYRGLDRYFRGMLLRSITNFDLQPESTKTVEFSVGKDLGAGRFEMVYHHSTLDNLIESVSSRGSIPGVTISQHQNVSEAEISGLDVVYSLELYKQASLNLSYQYLDAKDTQDNSRLLGRARHQGKVELNMPLTDQVTVHVDARLYRDYLGKALFTNIVSSVDHEEVNLKLNYQITPELELNIGVDNLLDEQMPEQMSGFLTPAPYNRFFYTGAKFKF
jgi:outer membrane receptor for ferrienterochelin and colicins